MTFAHIGGVPVAVAQKGVGAVPLVDADHGVEVVRDRVPGDLPAHARLPALDVRLAFTWLWDDNDTRQLIELDFEETDGATTVHFTHSGLWDEAAVRSHEGGWSRILDKLGHTLQEGGPG